MYFKTVFRVGRRPSKVVFFDYGKCGCGGCDKRYSSLDAAIWHHPDMPRRARASLPVETTYLLPTSSHCTFMLGKEMTRANDFEMIKVEGKLLLSSSPSRSPSTQVAIPSWRSTGSSCRRCTRTTEATTMTPSMPTAMPTLASLAANSLTSRLSSTG